MNQVELTITVTKDSEKEWYFAKLEGVKRPWTVEGGNKQSVFDKCFARIIHPEIFDVIVIDETYEADLLH